MTSALRGHERVRNLMPARGRPRPGPTRGSHSSRSLLALGVLVVATLLTYADALRGAFVFDDRYTIVADASLGQFSNLGAVLLGVKGSPTGGRPLTSLSIHLNALVVGRRPEAFHAVNIAIHLAAGLALFGVLRLLLRRAAPASPLGEYALPIAFAASLLWLVHPLTTESVTYVSQRAESLMGLFFLLAVGLALRGFVDPRPAPWFRASAVACALAVLAKEVGVIAPLVILLIDAGVESHGIRRALQRHGGLYRGLAASWVIAAALQLASPRGYSVSFADEQIGPLGYLSRQPGAVLTYLKLTFWPSPLVFDYGDPPRAPAVGALVGAAALLGVLLAAAVFAFRRWPLAGISGCAFFLILAPTSTVIPIVTEVIAEHRMYLPLACVITLIVGALVVLAARLAARGSSRPRTLALVGWVLLGAAAGTLGFLTWQRNLVYASELALWRDTVAKAPDNPRALNNLAMATLEAGNVGEAAARFREVLAVRPDFFEANGGLAAALDRLRQPVEALPYMRHAAELNPASKSAAEGLVRLLAEVGHWGEALAAGKSCVERFPDDAGANATYGTLLSRAGRAREAAAYLERARELAAAYRPVR